MLSLWEEDVVFATSNHQDNRELCTMIQSLQSTVDQLKLVLNQHTKILSQLKDDDPKPKKRKLEKPMLTLESIPQQFHIDEEQHVTALANALTTLYVKKTRNAPCFINFVIATWLCKCNWSLMDETRIREMFECLNIHKIKEGSPMGTIPELEPSDFYKDYQFVAFPLTPHYASQGSVVERIYTIDVIRTFVYESTQMCDVKMFLYLCHTILYSIPTLLKASKTFLLSLIRESRITQSCITEWIVDRLLEMEDTPEKSNSFVFVQVLVKLKTLTLIPEHQLQTVKLHVKKWKTKSDFKMWLEK